MNFVASSHIIIDLTPGSSIFTVDFHCHHDGRQSKRKFVHKVCIRIFQVYSQRRKILCLFLSTNMAAITSQADHQLERNLKTEPNFLNSIIGYICDD